MSYIYQSTNNSQWDNYFPDKNRTNFWVLFIGRTEPTTVQQVLEAISIQQLTVKYNRAHFITDHRDKYIIRTNIKKIDAYSIKSDTSIPLGKNN